MKVCPVILSGGSGTRLWPLSREHYPKQLHALTGERTLLQLTADRVASLANAAPALVVCNEEHRFLVAEQLRLAGRPPADIILEPFGRNTAPALTLAALSAVNHGEDRPLLVMPADHVLADIPAFQRAVTRGVSLVQAGKLVTFGIVPTTAETGYGYIRKGQPLDDSAGPEGACAVSAFVEKPDLERAQEYLRSGDYLWNSGMFMMLASAWLAEIKRHRPDILAACTEAWQRGRRDVDFYRVDRDAFERCPADSIDYAVMENTDRAAVVPLDAGWSDVGSWSSLWNASSRDVHGNSIRGDVLALDTHDALLISDHRLLVTLGVRDLVVVDTADAVLVAHRDHAQSVKDVVQRLKEEKRDVLLSHRRVYRPWGHFEGIDRGERFQVKRITVTPGAALSLQMHKHRAEHWVVVRGRARVTRGTEVFELGENQSTYIPIGERHRLENPGDTVLEMIEVQSGSYLGEDDIVRFEDRYSRD
jgi:mannose-1-phosphate guanylyltransferase/mannose-6-phosphate isomerase